MLDRLEYLEKLIKLNKASKRDAIEYTEIFRTLRNNFSGVNFKIKPEIRLAIDLKMLSEF